MTYWFKLAGRMHSRCIEVPDGLTEDQVIKMIASQYGVLVSAVTILNDD